jgi:hypothetical protein
MRTSPSNVHQRIAALVREDARTGTEWAGLLGYSRQNLQHRLNGRTPWTLCDAMAVAPVLGMSLDALVGDDDLDIGYAPVEASDEELPDLAPEVTEGPLATVTAIRWHDVPAYDDLDDADLAGEIHRTLLEDSLR